MTIRVATRAEITAVLVAALVVALVASCAPVASSSPASESPEPPGSTSVVLIGRIVTMGEPPVAEALFIEDGVVAAVGARDEVLARAGDQVPVVDLGTNVAYPGFIDAHAHWIGDREYYAIDTPQAAMDAAIARGWTSISEQWVNPERLAELTALAGDGDLPLRVDAYLALNFGTEFLGDWYLDHERGPVGDRLRVQGLKVHLDNGEGTEINWGSAEVTEAVRTANEAGWQLSIHAVSTEAVEMVLDAYAAAMGPTGPNPLHHRLDHAIQVSDEQLARMVAMDLATVIHPDGGAGDWVIWSKYLGHGSVDDLEGGGEWLTRWRDFVDAGLHVAAATDTPWFFPDSTMTDDISRPVDQIAGGMDSRNRAYPGSPDWMADQLLTAEQGLRAVTLDAAWALGDEGRRGHLTPGALGDVTILSGDVTDATPDEIRAMSVIATIVDGVAVHCADPPLCPQLTSGPT